MTSCNHKSSSSSRQSSSKRSSSCGHRKSARGHHLLSWYIPRYVNGGLQVPYTRCGTSLSSSQRSSSPNEDDRLEEIPSPLHDNSKQLWTLKYSDDKIRSLPIPPPYKPKLYEHEAPHANNLTHLFKSTNYPASVLYSRYGIPLFPSPYQVDKFNYHMWSNNPLQSMFAKVGGVQRRHFTVAPDWRHLSNHP